MERRKAEDYEETEAEAIHQTAIEVEDMWEAERKEFMPQDTVTGTYCYSSWVYMC